MFSSLLLILLVRISGLYSIGAESNHLLSNRIFPSRPYDCLPLLHASPPAYLLHSLQCFMSAGRPGWVRRAILQPVYHLWCSA